MSEPKTVTINASEVDHMLEYGDGVEDLDNALEAIVGEMKDGNAGPITLNVTITNDLKESEDE